ncbi:phage virion morphogenesis protein [Rosenbergiella australiborealis]|uniref:phage virion morphogenesis protein n=1 Tax=Rosenbergiella australiborealis TaxID=1544696 RepID=UPI001F4D7E4D|nr:phage virion morphogenesis protein [Rosenbergiella australiborealis]
MAELSEVDAWLSALVENLQPAARKKMLRELAQEVRRNQQANIRLQRDPDGNAFTPRKVTARSRKGRIKRQMFSKLRTAKYLKARADSSTATVEFIGQVQKVARVHHYGLRDRVRPNGPTVKYDERRLLGGGRTTLSLTRHFLLNALSR